MKFLCLLLLCALSMTLAKPQYQPDNKKLPQITTIGNGSFKQGNVNFDVRQQIWQSPNQRHSIDGTGGYSRNWGEPKPIDNLKNYRVGVGYTYRFKG
ncbi:diptericin-D-like [Lucilia sericata]|uniref:diptericin-D-like n=1 Tax=Lucilia sericata TaxID=13632 RepID=UPI0018A813A6|nr:diptericin-D-like [Lucilia sericata]